MVPTLISGFVVYIKRNYTTEIKSAISKKRSPTNCQKQWTQKKKIIKYFVSGLFSFEEPANLTHGPLGGETKNYLRF